MDIDRYLRRIVRRACFSDRIGDDWNKRMTLRRRQEVHHRVDATEESIGAKRQCDGHGSESWDERVVVVVLLDFSFNYVHRGRKQV